ncbi:porin family protein [bacterium]|nr:porin family protein [bacterium]
MKTFVSVTLALLLLAGSLKAQEPKLSLLLDAAPTFITGPENTKRIMATGVGVTTELYYRLNERWSLVPLSLGYIRMKFDKGAYGGLDSGNYSLDDVSLSLLVIAPAIQFNTSTQSRLVGTFQLGAGLGRSKMHVKLWSAGYWPELDSNSNDLLVFLSAGVEGRMNRHLALTARVRYWLLMDSQLGDENSTQALEPRLGLRFLY